MAYTIGNEQWEYLGILNVCIRLLLTILLGIVFGYFRVFNSQTFVPVAVKFVFHVCLPFLVLKGLGIVVDFYNNDNWNFIVAFLILRAIALVLSVGWVLTAALRHGGQKHGIGMVAVLWLTLTWISTVIIGVPISQAVFGDEATGLKYGLLAAVSSFIFQLPLQLLFLECHVLEQEYIESLKQPNSGHTTDDEEHDLEKNGSRPVASNTVEVSNAPTDVVNNTMKEAAEASLDDETEGSQAQEDAEELVPLFLWVKFARRKDVWKRVLSKVFSNPIIWGIIGGFILSLSTLGPRFLNPKSDQYVPGLGWIWFTLQWFGDIVSPLSLFAMGVWMQDQGKGLFKIPLLVAVLCMLSKLVIVPLIMVGLAFAVNLSNEAGRAAVLIAALPISMASFTLGSHYKIGEALLSENVALGTALMLPTMLIWNLAMDRIGIFPI